VVGRREDVDVMKFYYVGLIFGVCLFLILILFGWGINCNLVLCVIVC